MQILNKTYSISSYIRVIRIYSEEIEGKKRKIVKT